jgi:hypothetical protein
VEVIHTPTKATNVPSTESWRRPSSGTDLDKPNTTSNVQRNLAIFMQRQYDRNAVLLEWMLRGLRLDIVLLGA